MAEDLALDVKASIASKKSNAIELAIDTKNATLGENILISAAYTSSAFRASRRANSSRIVWL